MSNQGLRQQSVRDATGTALDYNGDWHALFDQAGIAAGSFNGRMLAWINQRLGSSYPDLPGAMAAFAADEGVASFNAIGTFDAGGVSLTAPTLTWTSPQSDTTPEFTIDGDFQADDILHLYRDGVEITTHTVTSGELAAGSVSLGLSAWANGTYSVTATIERSGVESGPSNTETVTIAAVATTFYVQLEDASGNWLWEDNSHILWEDAA